MTNAHSRSGVTQAHSCRFVILSSCSCRTKVSYEGKACACVLRAHVSVRPQCKQGPIFIFAFLVQFNSCTNLLSNYANEFTVGGSPCWPGRDLDSLEKGQKVPLARAWQCEGLQKETK